MNESKSNLDYIAKKLKTLIENAVEVTIKTEDTIVVLKIAGNRIIAETYETGSLQKISYHALASLKELALLFEELGLCFFKVISKLLTIRLTNKDKPLLLELKSNGKALTFKP
jgi:type III secretory pathway lipoprotein EscJ